MDKETFLACLHSSSLLSGISPEELQKMVEKYPYFQPAHMMLLKKIYLEEGISSRFKKQLTVSSFFMSNRKNLYLFLYPEITQQTAGKQDALAGVGDSRELLLSLTSEEPSLTIDEPSNKPLAASLQLYNRYFELDIKNRQESQKRLIDQFIENEPRIAPPPPVNKEENDQPKDIAASSVEEKEEIVSETLAEIYVKQQLYKKALAMYHKLSLKYPQKSAYFASRMEEIKKKL